jgi:hypothetical protein
MRDRSPPRSRRRRVLLPHPNLAASVYGTVLVSSVIVGLGPTELAAVRMMIAIAATAIVFALAHAWSTALARSAAHEEALTPRHVADAIRHEWAMVEATAPALIALGLAALGVYSTRTGLWVAIIANTFLLFVWGAILRHRAEGTPLELLAAGLTTAFLGLLLVLLKVLVH